MDATDHLPTTDRPCPRWCTLPAGHAWDWDDGEHNVRVHERSLGGLFDQRGRESVSVVVGVEERAERAGADVVGPSNWDRVTVSLFSEGTDLEPGQAVAVADQLREAALFVLKQRREARA